MNQLLLLVLLLVGFCFCGGKYCPSVLRQNKELLMGVAVGMASYSLLGMEGFTASEKCCKENRDASCDQGPASFTEVVEFCAAHFPPTR